MSSSFTSSKSQVMTHFGLFILVCLLCSINEALSEVYHITTNSTDNCTAPCLTLSKFATNSSHYLNSNTTLLFLPGKHYLTVNLTVLNLDKFSIDSEISTTQIVCRNHSHISFNCSQCIHITNVEFIGCGGNQVENVEEFVLQGTKFRGEEDSGTALELIETTALIVNSTFISNRVGKPKVIQDFNQKKILLVGGAIIATHSKVDISQSKFENNEAENCGAVFAEQHSIITMNNTSFIGNRGTDGCGGVMFSDRSTITIKASEFHNNTATRDGGALYSSNSTITIEASEFHNNIATYDGGVLDSYGSTVTIEASKFHNNTATRDGGVLYSNWSTITIEASEFHNNTATFDGGVLVSVKSTITIEASEFHNNIATRDGGVLVSYWSTITIEASEFHNNIATWFGGVLHSFDDTIITLEESEFHNNTAKRYGGVLYSFESMTITIEASVFHNNTATRYYGGVLYSKSSYITTVIIEASEFHNNTAKRDGGVLYSSGNTITIEASEFHNNTATINGGVLYSQWSTVTIEASEFHNSIAITWNGGVLYSYLSTITMEVSEFHNNTATSYGGVLYSYNSTITVEASEFHDNTATKVNGGALSSKWSNVTIEASEFHNNIAGMHGGVVDSDGSTITIGDSKFTNNNSSIGAVIYAKDSSTLKYHSSLLIANNSAVRNAIIYLADSEYISGNATISNNLGSLAAFNSKISLMGHAMFVNNQEPQTTTTLANFQEGGAITLFQSSLLLDGIFSLEDNDAENGGAVFSTESKLYVNGIVTIAYNTATRNGGGVYLSNSELNCQLKSMFVLFKNTAAHKGGGLHAISSSIKASAEHSTDIVLNFTENKAERGGGLSLEANAKLYVLKYSIIHHSTNYDVKSTIFTANTADYGGAVHVDDDTNSGTCVSHPKTECFFQVLAIHGVQGRYIKTQSIYFSQNHATISGSTLYGGLLDRCVVSPFAEVFYQNERYLEDGGNGVTYFKDVSTITNTSISSRPVQVCLCIDNRHNCTQRYHIEVKKGETFTVSLVAVDQIGHPVNGIIQTSLNYTQSGIAEGQLTREIHAECTDLTFNVVSPHSSEELTLYASDGPCKDTELSKRTLEIQFLPCSCAIGLQVSGEFETNCTCECHGNISQYLEQCDPNTGSFTRRQSQSKVWIFYINDTNLTGYLVYPNCPFDYCNSISLPVDLNQPNGANAQCAFSRSSLLCGSCQPNLSLSLGSSRCLSCPSYWPVLLVTITIAAALAGIALVALLLVLNMTVAVGTLNGLIFYANVLYANRSILLPFQETNFVTVFVSWLNLELGIDTCYFPGMDTYTKTWLQLAFPTYVIFLVVLVIIISSYSFRFSILIGKMNPVATLATLILLSYAKLLEISFKTLSIGILEYPDGSRKMLWLPDATVEYLSGKHIPLFIAAVLILLVGLVYTALLFSWQWILCLPKWKIFLWSRNQKLQTFIETYHTPYTPKHRYWTGLLLIVRAILYLVAAVNVTNDPRIALTAIIFSVCCIVLSLKGFIGSFSNVYRKWPVDVLETFFYLNIAFFALFTWYSLGDTEFNQKAAAHSSVSITFILLLLILFYHVYTYSVFSKVNKAKPGQILLTKTKSKCQSYAPPDDDIHELLDNMIINTDNYNNNQLIIQKSAEPTYSVIELHNLPPLPPPEEANTQDIPDTQETIQSEADIGQVQQCGLTESCIEQKSSKKEIKP